jgi:hypothetical protein
MFLIIVLKFYSFTKKSLQVSLNLDQFFTICRENKTYKNNNVAKRENKAGKTIFIDCWRMVALIY